MRGPPREPDFVVSKTRSLPVLPDLMLPSNAYDQSLILSPQKGDIVNPLITY